MDMYLISKEGAQLSSRNKETKGLIPRRKIHGIYSPNDICVYNLAINYVLR